MIGRQGGGIAIGLLILFPLFAGADSPDSFIPPFTPSTMEPGLPEGWKPFTFHSIERHTRYRLTYDGTDIILEADADNAASGIVRYLDLPTEGTTLSWRWKIEHPVSGGLPMVKEKDDFAARIYVAYAYAPERIGVLERVKQEALYLLHGRHLPHATITYVWGDDGTPPGVYQSPWGERARIVVLQSGSLNAGKWIPQQIDPAADYRNFFGDSPPSIQGIGIMTDTDNTQSRARAWYADLRLMERSKREVNP